MNKYQETLNVLKKKEEENNYKQIGLFFYHPQCDILQELVDAWEVVKNKIKPCLKLDKEEHQPAYYWWIADEIINLDTLEYQALKQALEVEEDA